MKKVYGLLVCFVFVLLLTACGTSPGTTSATQLPIEEPSADATSYYVRSNGNDRNAGTSEDAPFRTLTRAINVASRTSLKKITVIGTLTENVNTEDSAPSLIRRSNWDDPNPSEILITGKLNATENERAVLTAQRGHIFILHVLLAVRFEHIEISRANGASAVRVVGGDLTLAEGTKIINNNKGMGIGSGGSGGGVYLTHNGSLIMRDNAEISNNEAGNGGGITLGDEGGSTSAILTDNAVVANNLADSGGGIAVINSTLIITGNAKVINNTAVRHGGGIFLQNKEVTLYQNASVENNTAQGNPNDTNIGWGGGIFINGGKVTLRGNSSISDNTALITGGGIAGFVDAKIFIYDTPEISRNLANIFAGGVLIFDETDGSGIFLGDNVNLREIIKNNIANEEADLSIN